MLDDSNRVPLSATLPRPYTDPAHRRRLLSRNGSVGGSVAGATRNGLLWACPVTLDAVLARGAASGACPLPSAHDGYAGYYTAEGSAEASNLAEARAVVREVARGPLECGSRAGRTAPDTRPGPFAAALAALGASPALAVALQRRMADAASDALCAAAPELREVASEAVFEAAVAWSLAPGYVVLLSTPGGFGVAPPVEFAILPAALGAAAAAADAAGGAAAMAAAGEVASAVASGSVASPLLAVAAAFAATTASVAGGALATAAGRAVGERMGGVCEHVAAEEVREVAASSKGSIRFTKGSLSAARKSNKARFVLAP